MALDGIQKETLMLQEQTTVTKFPAITTVTFFRGDLACGTVRLRKKLAMVVTANPWLAGALETDADNSLVLAYPVALLDPEEAIHRLFNPARKTERKQLILHGSMDARMITEAVAGSVAEVPRGFRCIDNKEPLLCMSVVPVSSPLANVFAVVLSLSHVIADGFTYYRLLAMLSTSGEITALSPSRKHEFAKLAEAVVGEEQTAWTQSLAFKGNVVGRVLLGNAPFVESYYVDEDAVGERKQASKSCVDFVSTNDVISSSFSETTQADILLLMVNTRERFPDITSTDAGNYQLSLLLTPADFASPAEVRRCLKSIADGKSAATGSDLPGFWTTLLSTRLSFISNWTFPCFQELEVECCDHLLHIPSHNLNALFFESVIVYRPRRGQLAVLFATRDVSGDDLSASLPLGRRVGTVRENAQ